MESLSCRRPHNVLSGHPVYHIGEMFSNLFKWLWAIRRVLNNCPKLCRIKQEVQECKVLPPIFLILSFATLIVSERNWYLKHDLFGLLNFFLSNMNILLIKRNLSFSLAKSKAAFFITLTLEVNMNASIEIDGVRIPTVNQP